MHYIVDILNLFVILLFARVILSYFPITPGSAIGGVARFLDTVTEPVLGPVRRLLPPVRLGQVGMDLSPIIVFFVIEI
ncbi:MAG: YggT family protein, partial [Acidimicrobiales bacterium]